MLDDGIHQLFLAVELVVELRAADFCGVLDLFQSGGGHDTLPHQVLRAVGVAVFVPVGTRPVGGAEPSTRSDCVVSCTLPDGLLTLRTGVTRCSPRLR